LGTADLHAHFVEMTHELRLIGEVAARQKKRRLCDRQGIAQLMSDARPHRARARQSCRSLGKIAGRFVACHFPKVPSRRR
jgi:hypothetical protein